VTIKLAMEVDFVPGMKPGFANWPRAIPGTISSARSITSPIPGTWNNPKKISEWKHRDPDGVWTAYFERLTLAAESGLFEIIAHADLCKKFCFYPKQDCTPLFSRFLKTAKQKGVAMELNTAGLRKDCREIYPSPQIVQMAAKEGVPITFASDAHAIGEVGMNFAEAVALARSAGYTHYCRFHTATTRRREALTESLCRCRQPVPLRHQQQPGQRQRNAEP